VIASAALAASSDVGTIRRNTSKEAQEQAVKDLLAGTGMKEVKARDIPMLTAAPAPSHFCGEARLAGTRADVVARLKDGRVMAIECKVSNSTVNSYKRLVHDTGGKAAHWYNQLGRAQVLPSAVLSGCSGSTAWQTSPPSSKERNRAHYTANLLHFDPAESCIDSQPASAARMRAQLRVPLWKLVRSYFSFGECTRSSSSAKPTKMVSMPSTRLKSATIGTVAAEHADLDLILLDLSLPDRDGFARFAWCSQAASTYPRKLSRRKSRLLRQNPQFRARRSNRACDACGPEPDRTATRRAGAPDARQGKQGDLPGPQFG